MEFVARPILFPRRYVIYVVLAMLDLACTILILQNGGREINAIANYVLQLAGEHGMSILKFASVAVVLTICEIVGRHKLELASRLVYAAIAINAFPLAFAAAQAVGLLAI
ncbi:MAG: DUF5658 family protein [Planctomycetota bacterium]